MGSHCGLKHSVTCGTP